MTQTLKRIAARLQLAATYEGTKVKDLARYIKSMVPGARLFMDSAMMRGPGGYDPGVKTGILTGSQAHELGRKLITDGWYGRKVVKKIQPKQDFDRRTLGKPGENEVRERHYVYYTPSSENGVKYTSLSMPYIRLMKPSPGDDRVRIEFGQTTHASAREREFLRKLNRPVRQIPKITRRGGGGGGF